MIPVDLNLGCGHIGQRLVEAIQRGLRINQIVGRIVLRAAVVIAHDKKSQHLRFALVGLVGWRVILLPRHGDRLADRPEIAKRLGHFLSIHHQGTAMHPVVGQCAAKRALSLGDFIFMMGKLEVRSATMDVQRNTQERLAHGRALDMPARATPSVRRIPPGVERFRILCGFPKHEVQRIALGGVHRHPLTCAKIIQRLSRELAIAVKRADSEIHIPIGRVIGEALVLKATDDVEHFTHITGGARLIIRGLHPQRPLICVHGINEKRGDVRNAPICLHCPTNDFVVDISDVSHVADIKPADPEPTLHHIKAHQHAGMAKVTIVIHCHAADI